MKRSINEPSTSTGKRERPTRFTVKLLMETLANSDSYEADFQFNDLASPVHQSEMANILLTLPVILSI